MIHAFAVEPEACATWGRREEFRYIHDKFGLGTPRVFLEFPKYRKWKAAVVDAAQKLGLTEKDMVRIQELFRLFDEHKCRRSGSPYDSTVTWLENAEREYARQSFAAIIASANPRGHESVLVGADLDGPGSRWMCSAGESPARTPEALALALTAMLTNCRELHLVDPHFGPENSRHRRVLEALLGVLRDNHANPTVIRVHCKQKSTLNCFEQEAAKMADRLPRGFAVEFVRWKQRSGGEKVHNRYVLTDLGGVTLGVGLDAGESGETDDVLLLPRQQFERRWAQYVRPGDGFEVGDCPSKVVGAQR